MYILYTFPAVVINWTYIRHDIIMLASYIHIFIHVYIHTDSKKWYEYCLEYPSPIICHVDRLELSSLDQVCLAGRSRHKSKISTHNDFRTPQRSSSNYNQLREPALLRKSNRSNCMLNLKHTQ